MLVEPFEAVVRWFLNRRGIRSRWVETSVGRMHALDAPGSGDLPPFYLIHGISSSAVPFSPVLFRLRRHTRRLIAPDLPGHGASAEPTGELPEALMDGSLETFDALVDEPVIVFGNSLGGAAALRLALERPHKIAGLVLCSPAGAGMDDEGIQGFLSRFDFEQPQVARRFVSALYHRSPFYAGIIASEVRRIFRRPFLRRLVASFRGRHTLSVEEARGLRPPTLLLWGRGDTLMLPEMLHFFRQHLPAHSRIEEPEDWGHCPHLDKPGSVTRALVEFARRLNAGDKPA